MEGRPDQELSVAEHRERVAAARSSLSALGSVLWQAPSGGGPNGLAGGATGMPNGMSATGPARTAYGS
ncbi:hypothetical protein [Knoellia sp. p5-6-4]|uniref:hypothetical protein n=1 Tax=unclassified Knoellia TaxID=2618719 RepID=UPI0023DA4B03|nr:hypothetical protein [Knoellia sp. p5-6-4]MDF2144522.1 hypothetical protein [Knoellia sp. p5-6-4]